MKWLILLIPLVAFGYVPSDERIVDADQIKVLSSTYVTLKNDIDMDSNNIFGVTNLTVVGTTTLDTSLTGFAVFTSGVLSAQSQINLAADVSGILPIANGGTGSATQNFVDLTLPQVVGGVKNFSSELMLDEIVTPANPVVGKNKLYFKADGNLYKLDDVGTEAQVGGSQTPTTTQGDIIVRGVAADERLAKGADDQLFTMVAGVPQWANAPISTTLSNAGEIQTHDGTNNIAQAAPTLDGSFLVADLAQPTKMKWSDSITGLISQAMFVGKIDMSNDCTYARSSASTGILTDGDTCSATSITGNLSLPTNPLQSGIKILNFRTDGVYKVKYIGLLYNTNQVSACYFSISKSGSYEGNGNAYAEAGATGNRATSAVSGNIAFNSGDTGEVFVVSSNASASLCSMFGNSTDKGAWSVHFFPDSTSLAAVQNKELTAATANDLSAKLNSAGGVISSKLNWLDSCSISTNTIACTYSLGIVTQAMACEVEAIGVANRSAVVLTGTSTGFSFEAIRIDTGASTASIANYDVQCSKQGADINKSQVITGTFDKINSTKLFQSQAKGGSAVAITGGVTDIPFGSSSEIDPLNLWDGDSFLVPTGGEGFYTLSGFIRSSTNQTPLLSVTLDGVNSGEIGTSSTATVFHKFNGVVYALEGQNISLRSNISWTMTAGQPTNNHITIMYQPDTESIIKNLNDNNNIECQTKYLQANTTTVGVMPDLTYTVAIGKKYSISHSANITATVDHSILDGAIVLGRIYDTGGAIVGVHNPCFVATTTSITTIKGNAAQTNGGAGRNDTWSQLCRLPDNYICEGTP